MNINYIIKFFISIVILAIINGCGGIKPQVPAHAVAKKQKTGASVKVDDNLSKKPEYVLTVKAPVNMGNNKQAQMTVKAPVIASNGNKRSPDKQRLEP